MFHNEILLLMHQDFWVLGILTHCIAWPSKCSNVQNIFFMFRHLKYIWLEKDIYRTPEMKKKKIMHWFLQLLILLSYITNNQTLLGVGLAHNHCYIFRTQMILQPLPKPSRCSASKCLSLLNIFLKLYFIFLIVQKSSFVHVIFHQFYIFYFILSFKNKHLGKLMLSKHFDRILQLSITYPTSVSSNTFLYIQIEFFTKSNMEGKQLLSIYWAWNSE